VPAIIDAEFKLEDESLQFQRKNIEFLIHYYENGGKLPLPGQTMWLLDEKVVDKMPEKVFEGSAMWAEVVCFPLTLTYSITLYSFIPRLCTINSYSSAIAITNTVLVLVLIPHLAKMIILINYYTTRPEAPELLNQETRWY
jgi:hypothetical protein